MNCPKCGSQNNRVQTTRFINGRRIRRRICYACNERWFTEEININELDGMKVLRDFERQRKGGKL